MISAIVAVDNNWGIGYNGGLLEHIPEDLKYFKTLTTDHVVVMGRKTWDSLPKKPLPNRDNIVITRTAVPYTDNDAFFCDLEYLTSHSKNHLFRLSGNKEWFIIGGGTIYKELLPLCDRVYVTWICKDYENVDTYFPNLDKDPNWQISTCTEPREYNNIPYVFLTYERV